MTSGPRPAQAPTLQVLGAAGHVTGSQFLLRTGSHALLVDCGLVQEPALAHLNAQPFSFSPRELDAVLLTHAHLDHSGLLPRLVHRGFRGPIWSTTATRDIAEVILMDAARLNEEDADHRRRRAAKRRLATHLEDPLLYGVGDVRATMQQFETTEYGRRLSIAPGVFATFHDAGHILGAATVDLELPGPDGPVRVLFSGDLGRPNRVLLHDPDPPRAADFVVLESTYGDRVHPIADPATELADVINSTLEAGGNVVIPSFAVERAQEILFYLRQMISDGTIPPVVTFLDSPMATAVTRLFRRYPQLLDPEVALEYHEKASPFVFPSLRITETPEASKQINNFDEPAIIIAGAGMCNGGRVLHHLVHNLHRPESTVLLAGYQAAGTLGRQLHDGEGLVYIFGEPFEVRARIMELTSLSAHADRVELSAWLSMIPQRPTGVLLVHGDPESATALREYLVARNGWNVSIPAQGEIVELILSQ